jgi:hypothetical protein
MDGNGKSTAIKGATGEFYVASFLSALGFVVALPRGGVPSSDLLVTNSNCSKAITIQVKTATKPLNNDKKYGYGEYLSWSVSQKSKTIFGTSHWYAFVDISGWPENRNFAEIYFVPSKDVSSQLETDWNNKDSTRLFYSIFKQVNKENEIYTIKKRNSEFYKGISGFKNLELYLNHPQPDNQADGKR